MTEFAESPLLDSTSSGAKPRVASGSTFSTFSALMHHHGLIPLDVVVGLSVGLLTVAWMPVFVGNTTPRNAIAFALLPLGIGILLVAARRRDLAALAAMACAGVFVLSGLLAEAPRAAFVGQMPEWASVPALVTSLAWWAVGRELTSKGRALLLGSLTAGALFNGVVAIGQLIATAQAGDMSRRVGRASGLMSNPVFYGTLMVGVAMMWVATTSKRSSRRRLGLCGILTFMTALSGGRVVLLAIVLAWLSCVFAWRRRALVPIAASAVGLVAAELFVRLVVGTSSAVERVESGESMVTRLHIWRFALDAVADRPLLGWGPANAELAVMRRLDLEYIQRHWNNTIWWDPHNAVVFLLVSVGLIGTVATLVFLLLALRGSVSWPFVVGAGAMAVTWWLQPFTVHSLPIAMMLFGAAVRPPLVDHAGAPSQPLEDIDRGLGRGISGWQTGLLGAGAVIAIVLLGAALVIGRSAESGNPDRAAAVASIFGGDVWLERYLAEAYLDASADGNENVEFVESAISHSRRAADRYPTSENYQFLADAALLIDDIDVARHSLDEAVALEPWDPLAHARLLAIARFEGDPVAAERSHSALCLISEDWCDFANSESSSESGAAP